MKVHLADHALKHDVYIAQGVFSWDKGRGQKVMEMNWSFREVIFGLEL